MKHLLRFLPKGGSVVIDTRNTISITCDQPSYVAGDVVTGQVIVNCLVPFFCNGFILKVVGKESTKFEQIRYETKKRPDGTTYQERILDKFDEDRTTVDLTMNPYTTAGMFPAGQFMYPYHFQLPVGLSSSFKASGGEKGTDFYKCKSHYKLVAYADLPFAHDLCCKTKMVINEKFDKMVQPSYARDSKGFLLASGKLDCQVWLDKNAYFPGERVIAKLEANNTSTKNTRRVLMDVNMYITLRAGNHKTSTSYRVYRKEFNGFDPCFFGIRYLPFNAPADLQPSCDGHLINASYRMELCCDIPNAIDLAISLPVKLLAPQFLFASTLPIPEYLPPPPDESYRPPWQEDTKNCQLCNKKFGLLDGRHHCRHCHRVTCKKCSDNNLPLPNLGYHEPVRVCTQCLPNGRLGGVKYLAVSSEHVQAVPMLMQPGQMQPGMMQPGMVDPAMMQQGQMQPGMVDPGMMQPGQMQPGMMQPGQMQPGMVDPGMMQQGQMQPVVMQQPVVMPVGSPQLIGNREGWGYLEINGFVVQCNETQNFQGASLFLGMKISPPVDSQLFKLEGKVFIHKMSGKAIDVFQGKKSAGTPLILWDKHGGNNQQFEYEGGSFKSKLSGLLAGNLVMDTRDGILNPGQQIIINNRGGASQKFVFTRL